MNSQDRPWRIVFLGSAKVGKTNIIRQLLQLPFTDKHNATIEDIYTRDVEKVGDKVYFKIEILDTSGSYCFAGMLTLSISRATAFVLVCSVTDSFSINQLKSLYTQIQTQRPDFESIPMCIVFNKKDVSDESDDKIEFSPILDLLISELSIERNQIMIVSAKTGENINLIFRSLWNQNLEKKTVIIPSPKAVSLWTLLKKRRASVLENLGSSTATLQIGDDCSVVQKKLIITGKEETKLKLNSNSKSVFKKGSASTSKERKKGDLLKLDCVVS